MPKTDSTISDMKLVSPQSVYDDPKTWISIPHDLHESILKLMVMMFPDFPEKLKANRVHCLECEGLLPFHVYLKETGEER